MSWQSKVPAGLGFAQEQQGYNYSYDKLNRLKLADYTTAGKPGHFNEALSYDVMGNITSLERKAAGTVIDQLVYGYANAGKSNRLTGVTDNSGNNAGLISGATAYTYNDNGSLVTDNRKALKIEYNLLNLPKVVKKTTTGETITYIYDAAGRKLRKVVSGGNKDYIDGIAYDNSGNLEFFNTSEGRAVKNGGVYSYEYMLKDHLGNTRSIVKQDGSILQVPDYYAFGMEMNHNNVTPSPDNRYKYNGKEMQTELGLGQLDYGARFYDPVIGRWNVIDPLAEQMRRFSPYSYGFNNPIRFIDPDGMAPFDWVKDKDDNIRWDKDANSQATTKQGETYLGKDLTFTFNSYIDKGLWDGPMGSFPAGDKLTSTVNLTSNEDASGNLTSVDINSSYDVKATGGIFQGENYFPGQKNTSLDIKGATNGTATFEQHAMVNGFEKMGLGLMGYDAVNVAQKLTLGLSGNNLSVSAATDVFPSATLSVNGTQLFKYNQPSFQGTHGRSSSFQDNGMGGVTTSDMHRRPAPSFYKRYPK